MTAQPLPPGRIRAAFAPITRPAYCTCDPAVDPHRHVVHVATYDATVTDRTDATDAEFEARMAELDQLEVADVGADAALERLLALADEMDAAGRLPILSEFDRGVGAHQRDAAARIRAAVTGPQCNHVSETTGPGEDW